MTSTGVDAYRAHLERQGNTPATVKAYACCVEQLQRWSGKPIEMVTVDDCAAFVRQPHLRQASRNSYHRWLSAYVRWSGRTDLLAGVRVTRAPAPMPKPVEMSRLESMLDACETDEETAMLLLASTAGLRRTEIAEFAGHQLDRWDKMIRVTGKGGVDAEIPALPILLRHAGRMPSSYWFPNPDGGHVSPWTIWRRTTLISARAGVGHVPPHRLRHTYATELVRGGASLPAVQRMMRHSRLGTTQLYIGVTPEDLHKAGAVLQWAA